VNVFPGRDVFPADPSGGPSGGGWEALHQILLGNAERKAWEDSQPPVVCPYDGWPLVSNGDGELDCPVGDYRWSG